MFIKLKKNLPFLCLIIPSLVYANPQSGKVQEYLNQLDEKIEFISTYVKASKSYRKKREYTLQEQKDYTCNLKLLYSDLIKFQSQHLQLEMYSEVQNVNRETEDTYHDIQRSLKKLQVSCSEEIINVPIEPF